MEEEKYPTRRAFLVQAGTLAAATLVGTFGAAQVPTKVLKNPLPRWKGFNLLDFFSPDPTQNRGGTSEEQLKWIADWGFDFIRLPMAYPSYVKFDRSKPITPEQVRAIDHEATDRIEQLVYLAHKHNLHVSLNLHRAPGFCVNAGFQEPYNLGRMPRRLTTSATTGTSGPSALVKPRGKKSASISSTSPAPAKT